MNRYPVPGNGTRARRPGGLSPAAAHGRARYYFGGFIMVIGLSTCAYLNVPMADPRIDGDLTPAERAELQNVLAGTDTFRFFNWRTAQLVERLRAISWVGDVSVYRNFPNAWTILVEPSEAVALWRDDYYLDRRARQFRRTAVLPGLPRLHARPEQAAFVLEHYYLFQELLSRHGDLTVARLALDAHGEWALTTTGGAVIRFASESPQRLLRRFARVYARLKQNERMVMKNVNLNYTNGMAVEWCAPAEPRCVGA